MDKEITLIIVDEFGGERRLVGSKNALVNVSDYFNSLLTKFKNADDDIITIVVPNANIVYNIVSEHILKNYKTCLPEWKYNVETIRCLDYIGHDREIVIPTDAVLDKDDFEYLLDFVNKTALSGENMEQIITLLGRNMPIDFDLSTLSNDFLDRMVSVLRRTLILISFTKYIKILDYKTKEIVFVLEIEPYVQGGTILGSLFSNDRKYIYVYGCDGTKTFDMVYNFVDNKVKNIGEFGRKSCNFSHTMKFNGKTSMNWKLPDKISDTTADGDLQIIIHEHEIKDCFYSDDDDFTIAIYRDGGAKLFDLRNTGETMNMDSGGRAYHVDITGNKKKAIFFNIHKKISVVDIKTGEICYTVELDNPPVRCGCSSKDSKMLAVDSTKGDVKIWDLETGKLMFSNNTNPGDRVHTVWFTPSSDVLAWSNATKDILYFLDIESKKIIDEIKLENLRHDKISLPTYDFDIEYEPNSDLVDRIIAFLSNGRT
jgi:WD40 repeat protein